MNLFGFKKRYFSSLFRHRKMKSQKNEEEKKSDPTKDSSEILLILFSSSFPSLFLCLLEAALRGERTNKNRTEKNTKLFIPRLWIFYACFGGPLWRGGRQHTTLSWKRVSIVLKDSEKYFSGTFRFDEAMAEDISSPTVHLDCIYRNLIAFFRLLGGRLMMKTRLPLPETRFHFSSFPID